MFATYMHSTFLTMFYFCYLSLKSYNKLVRDFRDEDLIDTFMYRKLIYHNGLCSKIYELG